MTCHASETRSTIIANTLLLRLNDNPLSTRHSECRSPLPKGLTTSASAPAELVSLDTTREVLSASEWYSKDIPEDVKFSLEVSGKLHLLASILRKCESIGDKVFVPLLY